MLRRDFVQVNPIWHIDSELATFQIIPFVLQVNLELGQLPVAAELRKKKKEKIWMDGAIINVYLTESLDGGMRNYPQNHNQYIRWKQR